MAKTVRIFLTCDLHGERDQVDGVASIAFGYDGKLYELDLCHDHLNEFSESVGLWATAARPYGDYGGPPEEGEGKGRRGSGTKRSAGSGPARAASKEHLAAVREWARSQGMEVSERGRIPGPVMEAYEKANP